MSRPAGPIFSTRTSRSASPRRQRPSGCRTSSSPRSIATISTMAVPEHFARTIAAIRAAAPATTIEVLTPDFLRKDGAIETVVAAKPDVFNHNLETVPRLYAEVRPGARYFHSLRLLDQVKRLDPAMFTKSGIMVGLGEDKTEVLQVMDDLRAARGRFSNDRPISTTDTEASSDRSLCHAGRVRNLSEVCPGQGFPDGLGLAADALLVSRRRGFRAVARRPRRQARRGRLNPRMPTHAEQRVLELHAGAALCARRRYRALSRVSAVVRRARASRSAGPISIVADLIIGFRMFRERFTSRVALDRAATHRCDLCRGAVPPPQQPLGVRAGAGRLPHRFLCRFRIQIPR